MNDEAGDTDAQKPEWPEYPETTTGTLELAKIRYEAEVKEVADQRSNTPEPQAPADWPAFPGSAASEFAKAVYQAQVDEAIASHKTTRPAPAAHQDWPAYPAFDERYVDFAKAMYQAQVEETAADRRTRSPVPSAPPQWPEFPTLDERAAEFAKALYDAKLKLHVAPQEILDTYAKAEDEAGVGLMRGFHEGVRDVAKSAIADADKLPQLVITAAGAIVTLYTGLLGLVFAAGGESLPSRALIPALFLGIAIAFATGYAAYLTKNDPSDFETQDGIWPNATAHTNAFVDWVNKAIGARANLLRAAVVALGFGILFLPSPFVDLRGPGDATSSVATTNWPTPSSADPLAAAKLDEILFDAQVMEAAAIRADEVKSGGVLVSTTWTLPVVDTKVPIAELVLWSIALLAGIYVGAKARKASTT